MEITRRRDRTDFGEFLNAPLNARGGVDTAGYELVRLVRKGDIVIHYDSASEQITGVSRATGQTAGRPIWWAARGTYARKAGEQPQWLPGYSVALDEYRALRTVITSASIRVRSAEVLNLKAALEEAYPGRSLYYPWNKYADSVRTFQSYLAKFPRQALSIFPELAEAVAGIEGRPLPYDDIVMHGSPPEIQALELDVERAAGRDMTRASSRGQGFATDQLAKAAVEAHAMNLAHAHYSALGDVTNTARSSSWDYEVMTPTTLWHVEVKGTTGDPTRVILTPNEVEHAISYPHVALFIVSNIKLERDDHGNPRANGGRVTIFHPWLLDPSQLRPLGFTYQLQGHSTDLP